MKSTLIKKLIILLLINKTAYGADAIYVHIHASDINLAESAIHLLNCIEDSKHKNWILTENVETLPFLKITEKDEKLSVVYQSESEKIEKHMQIGQETKICDELFVSNAPKQPPTFKEASLNLTSVDEPKSTQKTVIYAALGAALLLGGFFYWKSKQPKYNTIFLNQ
ncbi:MAG: hypothetical protein M9962_00280 [Oligoflexia bacterium]|nr:hypothetical protein [Oligoflexia bacterium]